MSRSCPTESQLARGPRDLGQVVSLAGTVWVRVGWIGWVKGVNEGRINKHRETRLFSIIITSHLADEKIEALRHVVTCPLSQS